MKSREALPVTGRAYNIGMKTLACVSLAVMTSCASAQAQQEFVFIAATNNTMPLAQFDGRRLTGGILKDLGDAIADRLRRKVRFLDTPSKRVWDVLARGEADGVCYVMPEWAEGSFNWSKPLIPDGAAVIAHPSAPALHRLRDLANKPVGTVLGYHYPEVEVLGNQFVRDDAPSMEHNLSKISAGRRQYAIVELTALAYRLRIAPSVKLRTDLVIANFKARCAFSKRSTVPFANIEQAIASLLNDGSIDKILGHYQ